MTSRVIEGNEREASPSSLSRFVQRNLQRLSQASTGWPLLACKNQAFNLRFPHCADLCKS